jgi:WD40 repeat protein
MNRRIRAFPALALPLFWFGATLASADDPPKRDSLGPVWSVAYSPDGLMLATGSGNPGQTGVLALWDMPAGKTRYWLEHPEGVRSVAFSPDGKKVATGCWDKKVRIFEVGTGKPLSVLEGHDDAVNSVVFSPDGKTLASCSLDKTIILWDANKGVERMRLLGHEDWVLSIAFFPDGESLASAGKDSTLRVWDAASGKERQTIKLAGAVVEAVAVSPDGKTIATGGWDHAVRLWDVDKGILRNSLPGHAMGVLSLAFSPDGKTLASVCGDWNQAVGGDIKLWNMPEGDERATWTGHTDSIWCVRFAPDGRTLATAGRDKTVRVWEAATGKERLILKNGLAETDGKPAAPPTKEELNDIWTALASSDGASVQRGLGRLVRSPEQATPWLAERLKPAPKVDTAQEKRIGEWISKLDDDDFQTRESAAGELAKLGAAAGPAMRKALEDSSSAEVQRRLGALLKKLGKPTDDPEQMRALRAVEALELIDTADARKLLRQLADGAPEALLTQEADASCRRLAKRH